MLVVESFGPGGSDVTTTPASRVVIRDAAGNPICVAVVYTSDANGNESYFVSHVGDDEFEAMLRTLCIDRVVVKNRIHIDGD